MKFMLFDQSAVSEIISDRLLQITSFSQGAQLGKALKTGVFPATISSRLHFVSHANGIYCLTAERSINRIIFDLTKCPLFAGYSLNEDEALLIFQRTLRFAIKIWKNLRLSPSEHVSATSKKAVLFPFHYTSHSSFRVVIERDPTLRKSVPDSGQTLLVFAAGTQDNLGSDGVPDTRVAVDALNGVSVARGKVTVAMGRTPTPDQHLKVTELEDMERRGLTSLSFDQWLRHLTTSQHEFVTRVICGPERIEGPAGTGKTLCLILKSLNMQRQAIPSTQEHHSIFIAHSEATRRAIQDVLSTLDEFRVVNASRSSTQRSLLVTTLQQWCADQIGERISETELLDRDAMASKEAQLLHVLESLQDAVRDDFPSHRPLLSPSFLSFMETEDEWHLAEMYRHEIAVSIKGRASENFEVYKRLPTIRYNLPIQTDSDRGFVFAVFNRYKEKLEATGQFDTDDVVLTAMGQLDTPLWRRRRLREGFDSIFIDESHLFNLNELSLFHHLTRRDDYHPIVFAVDRSQAIGDRALTDQAIGEAIVDEKASKPTAATRIQAVFRSSPEILNVAQAVTASGATLFTNFQDPLTGAVSAFTGEEEEKSARPRYTAIMDANFETEAFSRAGAIVDDLKCSRSAVAIIGFSEELFKRLSKFARERHKPVEILERRGDLEVVNRAKKNGLFILSTPEYVGGLEFDGVILVGVDDLRLPPSHNYKTRESRHFVEYSSHNLLYVAITRARFRVEMIGDKTSKPSKLLGSAIQKKFIEQVTE